VPGFTYSAAMAKSKIVWDTGSLDRFLADPTGVVPGTSMGYAGIDDAQQRADLIAWLKQATATVAECSR
jgi:cytochrome c